MKNNAFTITVHMPDGDPESLQLITTMNWAGMGIRFTRKHWETLKERDELQRGGVYILHGHHKGEPESKIYVGQSHNLSVRISEHCKSHASFWNVGLAFVLNTANSGELDRTKLLWLEHKVIEMASGMGQGIVKNVRKEREPHLDQATKNECHEFFLEMKRIIRMHVFSVSLAVMTETVSQVEAEAVEREADQDDWLDSTFSTILGN